MLDLGYVGAETRHDGRDDAPGARQRKVKNADAIQWTFLHFSPPAAILALDLLGVALRGVLPKGWRVSRRVLWKVWPER